MLEATKQKLRDLLASQDPNEIKDKTAEYVRCHNGMGIGTRGLPARKLALRPCKNVFKKSPYSLLHASVRSSLYSSLAELVSTMLGTRSHSLGARQTTSWTLATVRDKMHSAKVPVVGRHSAIAFSSLSSRFRQDDYADAVQGERDALLKRRMQMIDDAKAEMAAATAKLDPKLTELNDVIEKYTD